MLILLSILSLNVSLVLLECLHDDFVCDGFFHQIHLALSDNLHELSWNWDCQLVWLEVFHFLIYSLGVVGVVLQTRIHQEWVTLGFVLLIDSFGLKMDVLLEV